MLQGDLERVAAARIGDWIFVGTVLPWLGDPRPPIPNGTTPFLYRLAEQAPDWRRLHAIEGRRLCVAGDFNQDLLTNGHYYQAAAARQALHAALAAADLECITGDADDPLGGTPELACIDHICIGGLRTCGTPRSTAWPIPGTLDDNMTDHYGVWADLEEV